MRHGYVGAALAALLCLGGTAGRTAAQANLADEIILLSKGARAREKAQTGTILGGTPGAGDNALGRSPGAASLLGERGGLVLNPFIGFTTQEPHLGGTAGRQQGPRLIPPPRQAPQRVPLYGPIELAPEEGGPADGLTLDQMIARLTESNLDLAAKFQEIPKAQADILTAGLRSNPLLFFSADSIPYGSYSPERPGATAYGVTVIQAIDINQKRLDRVRVAQAARRVLEAQYQDAVRVQIDNLYTAYVDALDARQTLRAARTSVAGLKVVRKATENAVRAKQAAPTDLDRVDILLAGAESSVDSAEAGFRQAKQALATLLHLPAAQADQLKLRDGLRTSAPVIPPIEQLTKIGIAARPDLVSYRLGVGRAQADVRLARAERIPDVFVLYSPFEFTNNGPIGARNTTSFGLSGLVTLPVFNRNQGNIRRAQINVSQTLLQMESVQRQIAGDISRAATEAEAAVAAVRRFETGILPKARKLRDAQYRLLQTGQTSVVDYLNAQRDYNDVARQYLEALARQRRAVLRLNTAVGCRLFE
jgi:cobalt-zinc-cadmium efflux system outer membrane protein